jgi:CheY-like chemotaxis protein
MPEPAGRPVVLVVDDEEGIRNLLTDILADLGYEAIPAADGDAAIGALRKSPRPPVLAIIDLVMPGKGGVETLRALRQQSPKMGVIVSTGYDDQIQEDGLALSEIARLEDFCTLAKPYKIDELTKAIASAMAKVAGK